MADLDLRRRHRRRRQGADSLERFIKLHQHGQPLKPDPIYLGEGEYAPVPLTQLEARQEASGQEERIGLAGLAGSMTVWEARLAAASEVSCEGTNDTDLVHRILANAEVPQPKRHAEVVARLLRYLPPKLRATHPIGQTAARQRFWVRALARMKKLQEGQQGGIPV